MKQHQRNGFYGSLRKQTSKFHKVNEFTVFSQFLGNLKFMNFFSASHKKLSLVLL